MTDTAGIPSRNYFNIIVTNSDTKERMEIIRDAPWMREAETVGYPVGDGYIDDEEEEEDAETFCEL